MPTKTIDPATDLDQGVAHWNSIAPHAGTRGGNACVTERAKIAPAPSPKPAPPAARGQEIGDHLRIEPPTPSNTIKHPLWFEPQDH